MKGLRAISLGLIAWSAAAFAQDEQVIDFQPYVTGGRVQTYFTTTRNGVDGFKIILSNNAAFPFVALNSSPLDWSQWDALLVEFTNPESRYSKIFMRVDDSVTADGFNNCRGAYMILQKGQTITGAFPLRTVPMAWGMRALPNIPGSMWMFDNRRPLNISNIVSFRFFVELPTQTTRLTIKNVRLVRFNDLTNRFHDEFGQYNGADWPGKVHSEAELIQKDTEEAKKLAEESANDRDSDKAGVARDEYGGWMDGPQFLPTGRFRTQFINGKWWIVNPLGNLFLSYGMNSIDYVDLPTIVTQRENMFTWLPSTSEPLGRQYSPITGVFAGPVREGIAYNFYGANLQRKYGDDYEIINHNRTVDRLVNWGFNTIGCFSDRDLWRTRKRIPYTAFTKLPGGHHKIPMGDGATMHDPFDPAFQTTVDNAIQPIAAEAAYDPYCMGWFIDNEPGWMSGSGEESGRYTLAYNVLKENITTSAAKQVFIADLRTQYGTIAALNTAWGYSLTSWEQLEAPIDLNQNNSTGLRRFDMRTFTTKFANEYFRIVKTTLRSYDSEALYLGCRFYRLSKEIQDACGRYADILSFNIYGDGVPAKMWYPDIAYVQKPFIMGEFHFGALDRGMFSPGLAYAFDQQDRAAKYQAYVKSVLENRAFVGAHWFQYVDQPLAGRMYDGENFASGFVSVADVPYPELVKAAKAIHGTGYLYRWNLPVN